MPTKQHSTMELVSEDRDSEHRESGQLNDVRPAITFGTEPHDIVINIGDTRFSCHKHVLVQHSLYFRAMFESGLKESSSSEISLKNIAPHHFQCLLEYFYTGCLDLTQSNVQEITELSSHLQVSVILDRCCDILLTMIEDDLCLSLMRLSNALMLQKVYNQSRKHALWHFHNVCQTDDFMLAPSAQIVDYLQDPHLNIDNEVDVFRAAAAWYCAQGKPCDVTAFGEFFSKVVNFHLMTEDEVALMEDLPVVVKNQALTDFVASLKNKQNLTALGSKNPTRGRTSPRNGYIICVGAHQFSQTDCQKTCTRCTDNQSAPLDVLGFEPGDCSLKEVASLSDHYPSLALDSGYRVCAIGHLVYVVGGEATLGRAGGWMTSIWCLNTLTWSWHKAGTLNRVRRHHGLCAYGSTLYLIGGIGRFRVRLASVDSFDTHTEEFHELPDMPYQETSPAVTQHRGNIYVFKNYAQIFCIETSTWTFLNLFIPVPGLPLYAHPHPDPSINGLIISCFNSQSLWHVDLDKKESRELTKFEKEGGGGVLSKGHFYHFQVHEIGVIGDTSVECYKFDDGKQELKGVLKRTILTSHIVTVPCFPNYIPSSSCPFS